MTDELPDLQAILAQAQQLQEQLLATQAELAQQQFSGTAGGGGVTATVNGSGDLVGVTFTAEVIDPDDPELLADLVVAAYRDAATQADQVRQAALDPLTGMLGSAEPDV